MDHLEDRAGSEGPSSPSDFYGSDAPDNGAVVQNQDGAASHIQLLDGPPVEDAEGVEDTDSSSEMDVSSSSEASSRSPSPDPMARTSGAASVQGHKRKASDVEDAPTANGHDPEEAAKKRKVSSQPALHARGTMPSVGPLPQELWQQVFLRLPPAALSRCLRVCKTFNRLLTKTKAQGGNSRKPQDPYEVRVLESETIWSQSRKIYFPNLPRPLGRRSELQMVQLIGGRNCQFCATAPVDMPIVDAYHAGPGPSGVRVIWAFGIRTCGRCLETNTTKDVEILVSPAASLRQGLPYAFRTPDLHIVPDMMRQMPSGIPSYLRANKVYYSSDVDNILQEYDTARSLGEGAAEEWRKGLITLGKEAMADASRWERWESQQRLGANLAQVIREYDLASFPHSVEEANNRSATANGAQPIVGANGTAHLTHPLPSIPNGFSTPSLPHQAQYQQNGQIPPQLPKLQRNPQEVEEARQARRQDIERRCLELEPPLHSAVLQHIDSFKAAMQITTPMSDDQWEMLKPRIMAQRETAELIEHQNAERIAALHAAIPLTNHDYSFLRPAKEIYDQEYERAQEPLRKQLGEYADDFVNGHWHGLESVDRDHVPKFAADCLLFVRKRYLEDKQIRDGFGNAPISAPRVLGQSTPPPEPFLSLDNVKWVHDNKVRPLTDKARREMFICSECEVEKPKPGPKWFAFEGLIQHYGAKHTADFSKGNIVVHWQTAEWPDEPPFVRDPSHWVHEERKYHGTKKPKGNRNTPYAGLQGPYSAPAPSPSSNLLSDLPFFTNNAQRPSPTTSSGFAVQGHPQIQHHQYTGPDTTMYGYQPYHNVGPQHVSIDISPKAQTDKLSTDAMEVWNTLDGVKELLDCVRVQTTIHHAAQRFYERFRQPLPLDQLTDALATNAAMRPIKDVKHGLACKVCVASQTDGSADYQSYFARIRNVKLYSPSTLILHFKVTHQQQGPHLDWTVDMIELPEKQLVTDLVKATGMDDEKLALVAAAFPGVFPSPLPKIGMVIEASSNPMPESGLASRLVKKMSQKQEPKRKKGLQLYNGQNGAAGRRGSEDSGTQAGEDEYDPSRPMVVPSKDQTFDPARFDTDVERARKPSAPLATPPQTVSNAFNLNPDTLAALTALTGVQLQQPAPAGSPSVGRQSRSPSVGRAEPQRLQTHMPPQGPPAAAAGVDLQAILAALGHVPQSATPTSSSTFRASSAPRHHPGPIDPYHQSQPTLAISPDERAHQQLQYATQPPAQPPQAGYAASPPAALSAGHDLQATLARSGATHYDLQAAFSREGTTVNNSRQHQTPLAEQQHAQYADVSRSSPQQYRYPPWPPEAPPRHPSHALGYGEPAPIQYVDRAVEPVEYRRYDVQPPSHHHTAPPPPQQHRPQHQHQHQHVLYVDEYGRPLVPVDAAPAPVQYMAHPYEQSYYYQGQPGQ